MKKQLLFVGITIIILTIVGLSGCEQKNNTLNNERNRFVGTWTSLSYGLTIVFFPNGTYYIQYNNGTYTIEDGKLFLITTENTLVYNYAFSNNDKTLTLIGVVGGESLVFTKQ